MLSLYTMPIHVIMFYAFEGRYMYVINDNKKGMPKADTPFLCVNGYVLSGTTKATHHHGHATTTEASATFRTLWACTLATKQIQSVRYTEHYV